MSDASPRACGTWNSPLRAAEVARGTLRLAEPTRSGACTWWLEGRPGEGGRTVLVRQTDDGEPEDMIPGPYSVRSRVHEYGGGAWALHGQAGWFVNNDDQAIYGFSEQGVELWYAAEDRCFANLVFHPPSDRLFAVCEQHTESGEPVASVVSIGENGDLVEHLSGADFYASLTLDAAGERIAWLEWDHPSMPWDGTRLWVAGLDGTGELGPGRCIAGSREESIFQPLWGPDGALYFSSDANDWWNIHRWADGRIVRLTDLQAEFGMPQWVFGQRCFDFPDGERLHAAATAGGDWRMFSLALPDGEPEHVETGFTSIDHLSCGGGCTVLLGGSPTRAPGILKLDPDGTATVLARSGGPEPASESLAVPRALTFPVEGGELAHGLYYAPVNPAYRPLAGEVPPLIVKCHGGPTGAADTALDFRIQYWTSRGFGVLDLNYRGSTGFGREYRRSLYGRWGQADVADCVAGARHLCDLGLADPRRLLISGGSAGGYTVLCALAFTDVFAAGASYYGIGDLAALFATTHKFESRYDHHLLGEDPDAVAARSPLLHADRITCPVIFFQGFRDRVVPPEQSRRMHESLVQRGVPTAYVEFAEESHGFRQSASIERALRAELAFFGRVLGLATDERDPDLTISNASGLAPAPS